MVSRFHLSISFFYSLCSSESPCKPPFLAIQPFPDIPPNYRQTTLSCNTLMSYDALCKLPKRPMVLALSLCRMSLNLPALEMPSGKGGRSTFDQPATCDNGVTWCVFCWKVGIFARFSVNLLAPTSFDWSGLVSLVEFHQQFTDWTWLNQAGILETFITILYHFIT